MTDVLTKPMRLDLVATPPRRQVCSAAVLTDEAQGALHLESARTTKVSDAGCAALTTALDSGALGLL